MPRTLTLVAAAISAFGFMVSLVATFWPPERASAQVEGWHPGSSWLPHAGWTTPVKRLGELAGSRWTSPYNQAVQSWNGAFSSFDPFRFAGEQEGALVHFVAAGSQDEIILDALKGIEGRQPQGRCDYLAQGRYVWAIVGIYYGPDIWPHYADYKICVWPSRVPAGWEYLTMKHELGHVLGLGDDADGLDNCLMRSGTAMRELCPSELNWLRSHLGRN